MSYESALAAAAERGTGDPDGSLARAQWRALPAPIPLADVQMTQPVPRAAVPEKDNELTRLIGLASLG